MYKDSADKTQGYYFIVNSTTGKVVILQWPTKVKTINTI